MTPFEEVALLFEAQDYPALRAYFYHRDPDLSREAQKIVAWGKLFLPDYLRDETPPFHYELIKENLSPRNEYTACPRGFAKTTLNQVCICYEIANRRERFIVVVEKTFNEAAEVLEMPRREFRENQLIKLVYGDLTKLSHEGLTVSDNPDAQGDLLINGVRLRAKGFNAPIRGLKSAAYRPTKIYVDDVEEDEHIRNEEQRRKYRENYSQGIVPSVDIGGTIKVRGTILHQDSLLKNLIDQFGGRIYKAFDPTLSDPTPSLLWPQRWTLPLLMEKKKQMEIDGSGSSKFCTPPETPILMSDFSFKRIDEIVEGDELVGFLQGSRSKMVRSKVVKTFKYQSKISKLTLSNGDIVRCTPEHKWFTGRSGDHSSYLPACVGRKLMRVVRQPRRLSQVEAEDFRYLAGMIDGEGACKHGSVSICQSEDKNPEVYAEIERVLRSLRIPYSVFGPYPDKSAKSFVIGGGKDVKVEILNYGRLAKKNQMLSVIWSRPTAFIREKPRVVSIEDDGEGDVFALQTETGNYVAWGYASSNSQEYLNEPVDDLRRAFPEPALTRTFTPSDLKFKSLNRFIAIDAAESKNQGSDDTGVVVVDVDDQNNWFVRHVKKHKVDSAELTDLIFELWQYWKPHTIGVEKKAFEFQVQPYLKIKAQQTAVFPHVVELKHGGTAKTDRIRGALQGLFENGKIWFTDVSAGQVAGDDTASLKGQLRDFPFGKHDDLADALAYISQIARRPSGSASSLSSSTPSSWREFFKNKKSKTRNLASRL